MNRTIKRLVLPVGAAAILGTTGFAYMASGTLDTSYASVQTGSVDGYHVSNVHYITQDEGSQTTDQRVITAIRFDLDHNAAAANVSAYMQDTGRMGTQYYTNCANNNGTPAAASEFVCQADNVNNITHVDDAGFLTVRASQ